MYTKTYFISMALIILFFNYTPVYSRPSSDERCPYRIMSLAYSPDGAFITTGMDDGEIKIWNLSSRKDIIFSANTNKNTFVYNTIDIIKYSPDGRHIVSFGDNVITIWDGRTGNEIRVLESPSPYFNMLSDCAVYWDNKKKQITCIGSRLLITWNINTGRIVKKLNGEQFGTASGFIIAINPNGTYFVRGSSVLQQTDTILLWNIKKNRQEGVFTRQNPISAIKFSPNGRYILIGERGTFANAGDISSTTGVIRLLDTHSMTEVYNIFSSTVARSFDFNPDGKNFIVTLSDRIILFDTVTGEEISTFLNPNNGRYTNAIFSPDGRFIAIGLNHNIRIWNISSGEYIDIMASESEEDCEYEK